MDYETLARQLSAQGRVDLVGKSFGVIKFTGQSGGQWDFSLPRRDSKMSAGHKGFQIEVDPGIDPKVAASRRDFTINALMFDPRTGEYLDFFGGRQDLERRVLRHTSSAFVEDPFAPGIRRSFRICRRTADGAAAGIADVSWLAAVSAWMSGSSGPMSQRPSAGLRFLQGPVCKIPEIAASDGHHKILMASGDVFTPVTVATAGGTRCWRAAMKPRRVLMLAVWRTLPSRRLGFRGPSGKTTAHCLAGTRKQGGH